MRTDSDVDNPVEFFPEVRIGWEFFVLNNVLGAGLDKFPTANRKLTEILV